MVKQISNFSLGFKKFLAGFSFLMARPKLWWLAIVPMIISMILLGVMFTGFFHYYGDLHTWIVSHMGYLHIDNPTVWWQFVLNIFLWVLDFILQALVVIISILLILIVFYVITLIISSPFNDMLSEKVEEIVTGKTPAPFSLSKVLRETAHTAWIEFLKGVLFIAVPVVSLVLIFIPVVGGPLYVVLTIVFGMWDLGFTYVDYPMGRIQMSFKDRLRFAWEKKYALIGFGSIFIIPFASFFVIAPMTVGGTLMFEELKEKRAAQE